MSDAASQAPSAGQDPPTHDHRARVLYVESSPELRARIRSLIEPNGFEFDEAADAQEALGRAETTHPDLVLVDGHLTGDNAAVVARELRSAGSLGDVPLIAHGQAGDRAACLGAGFDGFLDDPLDDARLPQQLNTFLIKRDPYSAEARVEGLTREVAAATGERNRLREQSRMHSEFMRNLAHELATPLTPLVGYLKLLRSGRLGPLSERQAQVIEAMVHATERLGHSIDNLVDYATLEGGKYRVLAVEFDAGPMVDDAVKDLHARARTKHVRVDVRKPEHVALRGDERKLKQALTNVLDNALRASPHGGRVLLDVTEGPDRITFAVYDQGPGLPPEVLRVGEGVALLHSDERAGGVGLGLPVARRVVTAHGGELMLESPPKDQPDVRDLFPGSRVGFWIPRQGPATAAS